MVKVFGFNDKGNGSYIDTVSKTVGTNANGIFHRTEKGLGWYIGGTGNIQFSSVDMSSLVGDGNFTIVGIFKSDANNERKTIVSWGDVTDYIIIRADRIINDSGKMGVYVNKAGVSNGFSSTGFNVSDYKYHLFILIRVGTTLTLYIDSDINTFTDTHASNNTSFALSNLFIGDNYNTTMPFYGLINRLGVYDYAISFQQRQDLYEEFLNASPVLANKFPKYGRDSKPVNDNTPDTLIHYNCIPQGNSLTDITNNEGPAGLYNISETFNGISLNGINSYVSVNLPLALAATVKTICFRAKLASTTEMIFEGQSNNLLILANAGTLEASDYDHIYINGVEDATVYADQWMNIVVTSSTVVDNNTPSIGYNSGTFTYGKFEVEDFKISDKEFVLQDAVEYHNSFSRRLMLDESFELDPVT